MTQVVIESSNRHKSTHTFRFDTPEKARSFVAEHELEDKIIDILMDMGETESDAHNHAVAACESYRGNPNCVTRYTAIKACNQLSNAGDRIGLKIHFGI